MSCGGPGTEPEPERVVGRGLPERPLLRPGTEVTRRDDGHLQVGLDPSRAVVTEDIPAHREALRALAGGVLRPAASLPPAAARLLHRLYVRELVVDGARLRADLPASVSAAHAVAAVYARSVADAPEVLGRRDRRPVGVELPSSLRQAMADVIDLEQLADGLLAAGGVPRVSPGEGTPYVVLLASMGELDRHRVDALTRVDRPHLVLAFVEGAVRLGPFVVPGRTACLRCVDAGLGESDPRRSLVVEQYSRVPAIRRDGVPAPLDPALVVAALAWAVRELIAYVDDETPASWSATVELGLGPRPTRRRWPRHPQCGCAWDDIAAVG